jgi:cell division protein FtsL
MDLTTIKDSLYIAGIMISAVVAFYKIAKNLNTTLLNLNYEISKLNDNMDYTQKEMRKANEITNQRLNKGSEKFNNHEVRITKLETWRDSK